MPQPLMQRPDIGVLHSESISESCFDELKTYAEGEGLHFDSKSYNRGPQAGVEWLLPTALVAYFFKSYFDGIFKEIGKDHYSAIKAGLKPLWSRLLGPTAPKMVIVGTQGKVRTDQPYSLIYSIVAEAGPKLRFKLMFPSNLSEFEYEEAVSSFFLFLKNFHSQSLTDTIIAKLQAANTLSGTILLVYDQSDGALRVLDPFTESTAKI